MSGKDPVSVALLVVGAIRVAAFAYGVWYGWRHRHVLMVVGFGMATVSSSIFAFSNAGIHVTPWVVDAATYWATPTAIMLVAAATFNDRIDRALGPRDGWRP